MIRAAILGSPVSHSLSPLLHTTAYRELGIEGSYIAVDLTTEGFQKFIDGSLLEDWTGFSLTMPLKESAFGFGFLVESTAARIHSTNTLIRIGDSYQASSTDYLAFQRLLSQLSYSKVAIIGGGGTARAALGALDGRVTEIDFLLRNQTRQQSLQSSVLHSKVNFYPMSHSLANYDLVIATTPEGVTDEIAENLSSANGILVEALYNPWPTKLLQAWADLGGQTLHGLDVLVEQALDQIHLMSKIDFDYDEMRKILLVTSIASAAKR